jgi:hypothetical protein
MKRPNMDVTVTACPDGKTWTLTDLLGRGMGSIRETTVGAFVIQPEGQALQTLAAIKSQTYASVDAALSAIEEHTRGVCRRASP